LKDAQHENLKKPGLSSIHTGKTAETSKYQIRSSLLFCPTLGSDQYILDRNQRMKITTRISVQMDEHNHRATGNGDA